MQANLAADPTLSLKKSTSNGSARSSSSRQSTGDALFGALHPSLQHVLSSTQLLHTVDFFVAHRLIGLLHTVEFGLLRIVDFLHK
jgi:hypothetical protein